MAKGADLKALVIILGSVLSALYPRGLQVGCGFCLELEAAGSCALSTSLLQAQHYRNYHFTVATMSLRALQYGDPEQTVATVKNIDGDHVTVTAHCLLQM